MKKVFSEEFDMGYTEPDVPERHVHPVAVQPVLRE